MFKNANVMYPYINMQKLSILSTLFLLLIQFSALADSATIRVRSVMASRDNSEIQSFDPSIKDLELQLKHLPFTKFQLVGDQQEELSMKSKEYIKLANGDKLSVRPLYMNEGKLCIWLRWVDSDGMQVLDTRLHIEPGKSILAGTESSEKRATVLAVGVVP